MRGQVHLFPGDCGEEKIISKGDHWGRVADRKGDERWLWLEPVLSWVYIYNYIERVSVFVAIFNVSIYIYISLLAVSFIYVFLLRAASAVPRARIAGAKKACLAKAATHVRTANCAFIYIYIYRYTFKPQSTYGLYDYISIDLSQRSSVDWWIALQEERLRWDGGVLRCHQGERFTRTGTGWRGDPKEIKGLGGQLSTYHFRAQINI